MKNCNQMLEGKWNKEHFLNEMLEVFQKKLGQTGETGAGSLPCTYRAWNSILYLWPCWNTSISHWSP